MEQEPKRPTYPDGDGWELLDEDAYPEQIPHTLDVCAQNNFSNTDNIYFIFDIYLKFLELELYPPRWALEILAERFRKHISNPDPELFASQIGVSGRTSGATNPYKQFADRDERMGVLTDIILVLMGFNVTFSDAARAVLAKYDLPITHKRLMAMFREEFGGHEKFLARNRPNSWDDPFLLDLENGPEKFLSTFPRSVGIKLRKKRDVKT